MPKVLNPFVRTSPLENHFLKGIIQVAGLCYERGWVWGTSGNFSVHLRDHLVWQSPSGVCKGMLKAWQFLPVDARTSQIIWPEPGLRASGEMAVHMALYRNIQEAKCVIHTHPPALVHMSHKTRQLQFQGEEMQKVLGCKDYSDKLILPVAPNQTSDELDSFCQEKLPDFLSREASAILFAGHGVYAWGSDPFEAMKRIEALELLCQTTRNTPLKS